jgi:ABC-type transport system involved in cytochrome bd biosynthesis fused ATPase/permease subunit
VLKQGELISEGTWEELESKEGAFKDLLDAQS